jgi:hypothetical protein
MDDLNERVVVVTFKPAGENHGGGSCGREETVPDWRKIFVSMGKQKMSPCFLME